DVTIDWQYADGDRAAAEDCLCMLTGPTQAILSGECTALNFLQLLSGIAGHTRDYVDRVSGTGACVADTCKTLPGLRSAQDYAVNCGGGRKHRFGQSNAFVLKKNHLAALGSITAAVRDVRAD